LCLSLLCISTAAQSHLHPDDLAATAKHCPICQIAHSSAQVAVIAQLDAVLTTTAYLTVAQESDCQSNFDFGWHFSRPPPQA
jgi:hypothetical protein